MTYLLVPARFQDPARMRGAHTAVFLASFLLACTSDPDPVKHDAGEHDAGDAGEHDAGDAPVHDASLMRDAELSHDASELDGSDIGDADAEPDGSQAQCVSESGYLSAGTRLERATYCSIFDCVSRLDDMLERARSSDASPFTFCPFIYLSGCGVDTVTMNWGTHGLAQHYSQASGELIGAENLDDISGERGGCIDADFLMGVVPERCPGATTTELCEPIDDAGM